MHLTIQIKVHNGPRTIRGLHARSPRHLFAFGTWNRMGQDGTKSFPVLCATLDWGRMRLSGTHQNKWNKNKGNETKLINH